MIRYDEGLDELTSFPIKRNSDIPMVCIQRYIGEYSWGLYNYTWLWHNDINKLLAYIKDQINSIKKFYEEDNDYISYLESSNKSLYNRRMKYKDEVLKIIDKFDKIHSKDDFAFWCPYFNEIMRKTRSQFKVYFFYNVSQALPFLDINNRLKGKNHFKTLKEEFKYNSFGSTYIREDNEEAYKVDQEFNDHPCILIEAYYLQFGNFPPKFMCMSQESEGYTRALKECILTNTPMDKLKNLSDILGPYDLVIGNPNFE